jgi:hypothetical protein
VDAVGIQPGVGGYGPDIIMNSDNNSAKNMAAWEFNSPGGSYNLQVEYAAADARSVKVIVNGETWRQTALNKTTGCWEARCQQWDDLGAFEAIEGTNKIVFERHTAFPHIRKLRITPIAQ